MHLFLKRSQATERIRQPTKELFDTAVVFISCNEQQADWLWWFQMVFNTISQSQSKVSVGLKMPVLKSDQLHSGSCFLIPPNILKEIVLLNKNLLAIKTY